MSLIQSNDTYLQLSGIQHMAFCPRQWALIHVEQVWDENAYTAEGRYLHQRADNPYIKEKRKDLIVSRAIPIISNKLRLQGIADIVEFYQTLDFEGGIVLKGRKGFWQPVPVEYKRGKPKPDDRDNVQVCAQAMCLEEMLEVHITKGYLYYAQTQTRAPVDLSDELRLYTMELAAEMNALYEIGTTPPAIEQKRCKLCSLVDLCEPKLTHNKRNIIEYIEKMTKLRE